MKLRVWIMGSATATSLLILLVTLLAGQSEPSSVKRAVAPIPGDVPTLVIPPSVVSRLQIIERADNVSFRGRTGNDQPITMFVETARAQADGVVHVTRPRTILHEQEGRAIEIRADTGRIIAPDGNLHHGELQGNVVVTLFDLPPGQSTDHDVDHARIRMRIRLKDAHFDYEHVQISSDKDVVVEGNRFLFKGSDLVLTYNELLGVVDRLVIKECEELRFIQRGSARDPSLPSADGAASADQATPIAGAEGADFYEARFEDDVRVRSGQLDVRASEMVVVFGEHAGYNDPSGEPTDSPVYGGYTRESSDADLDEVVVTSRGPLTVQHLRTVPPDLTGADDMHVKLIGQPIRINTTADEHIKAASVSYLINTHLLSMRGSEDRGLEIDSPELGRLNVPRLQFSLPDGTGQLIGPGQLRTRSWSGLTGEEDPEDVLAEIESAMPPDMSVNWSERVDLTFFPAEPGVQSPNMVQRRSLRSIDFYGDVEVHDPSFEMNAEHVGIEMDAPDDGKPAAHSIHAAHNVSVNLHRTADEPPLVVHADQVDIETTRDAEGKTDPSHLRAEGHVELNQSDRTINTGLLEVELARGEDESFQAAVIDAKSGVRMEFFEEGSPINVHADRARAERSTGQVELFGTQGRPARIVRDDAVLHGRYIIIKDENDTMHVVGPGTAHFKQLTRPGVQAAGEASPALAVTWSDSMTFNHRNREAHFLGNVKIEKYAGLETTLLTAREIRLLLNPIPRDPKSGDGDQLEEIDPDMVRHLNAQGDVVFLNTKWRDKVEGKLATRLRIAGTEMVFDNTFDDDSRIEHIRFIGDGKLLLEDRRPKSDDRDKVSDNAVVRLSGRGVTVFTWRGQLLLDAWDNDMRINDKVWMVHESLDEQQWVVLECDHFVANLEPIGGLGRWTTGVVPKLAIVAITAEGGVVVKRDDLEVRTSKLKYSENDKYITLTANEGEQTMVTRGDATFRQTDPLYWNVETGHAAGGSISPARTPLGAP